MDVEVRGERAAQILDADVYKEAVAGAKQRIQNKWAATEDQAKRDSLWHELKAIEAVTRELVIIRDNGIVERTKREKGDVT
jgi:hypothetical protein